MINEYIQKVKNAIDKATRDETKLIEQVFQISGMSSREGRILLNELVSTGDKYLEIGVHKGSTFVSALYGNDVAAVAIDNFSQFGSREENKTWFDRSCEQCNVKNYTFIDNDCFNLSDEQKELVRGANVYFYDGDHRHEDQEQALTYYVDLLTKPFILIVDDWNHGPARTGTRSGIELSKLTVHEEWILDGNTTQKGWHNGLYVAILSK